MDAFDYTIQLLAFCRKHINHSCSSLEAWEIIVYSVITTLFIFYIINWIQDAFDDGMYVIWHFIRSLPIIKQQVQKKMKGSTDEVELQLQKGLEHREFIQNIPKQGWTVENIKKEVKNYLALGKYEWDKGYVSGAVYTGNDSQLSKLMGDVYEMTAYTNPLHPDVFPGVRIMEAEIIKMVSSLFYAPRPIGTVTSGGTESIFLVCKAYRDYAKYEKRIKYPNMVIPVTAHAAFDKAARLLKIKVKHVNVEPGTTKVNMRAMRRYINGNTCMLVGSSPAFPHGSIDPIEEIASLGCKYNIPVHVDACLGGFLVPFMEKAGFPLQGFDFRVPGVTSISIDTHKYAYAPKGSSIILYRSKEYRHYQYSVQPDWPGGIYGTPNLSGSRSGGIVATCWASLLYHGQEYYVNSTQKIISTTRYIVEKLQDIKEIHIIGKPEVSVIAIGSKVFDIYRLSAGLTEKGWNLNSLQFPSGFHICITMQHTYDGVADKFVADLKDCVKEIMKDPGLPTTGSVQVGFLDSKGCNNQKENSTAQARPRIFLPSHSACFESRAALYGMAQQIPDRSLVTELVWTYLDACYTVGKPVVNGVTH